MKEGDRETSSLIVTPAGKQVLIDGGPGADSANAALAGVTIRELSPYSAECSGKALPPQLSAAEQAAQPWF